jgi:hypothetical protein
MLKRAADVGYKILPSGRVLQAKAGILKAGGAAKK